MPAWKPKGKPRGQSRLPAPDPRPPRAKLTRRAAAEPDDFGAADFARELAAATARARGGWEIDDSVRVVPTVMPGLNRASVSGMPGTPGGLMMGTTMILRGPESGGKTTTATALMVSVQQAGGVAAHLEAPGEQFSVPWAVKLGLDRERFVQLGRVEQDAAEVPSPLYIEQAYREVNGQIATYVARRARFPFVIVVDSLTKFIPNASVKRLEKAGDAKAASVGRDQAQYNTTWVKDLGPKIADHNICVIFIVHDMEEDADGNARMKGGKGIRYDASLVLHSSFAGRVFDRASDREEHKTPAGKKHRVRVDKSKAGPQLVGEATSYEYFITPDGFDWPRTVLSEAARRGAVSGIEWKWDFSPTLGTAFQFQGARATLRDLQEDPGLLQAVRAALT